MLAFWQALHGFDNFTPGDAVGTENLGLGLVSHLAQQTPHKADNIVENLAKRGITLQVKIDGKTTDVKSTKQYRELRGLSGPGDTVTQTKNTVHVYNIDGMTIYVDTKTTIIESPEDLSN
jgi:hypothetical protein